MDKLSAADTPTLDATLATHRQAFIRVAEKVIGCRSRAEDIVHDAIVKIIVNSKMHDVEWSVGYLMKIVYNQAIDDYRRRLTETRVINSKDAQMALVTEAIPPDRINMQRQALRVVVSALSELPERTRFAFEAHRIQGISQRDIAELLGVSPTLVNFMIRDAQIHCRSRIETKAA